MVIQKLLCTEGKVTGSATEPWVACVGVLRATRRGVMSASVCADRCRVIMPAYLVKCLVTLKTDVTNRA